MDPLNLRCQFFLVSFFPSSHFGCIVALVQVGRQSLFCSIRFPVSPSLAVLSCLFLIEILY
ncbi:hypothetical protein BO86DRAFT_117731 [Aspergillus japonicus CBS 114.51]|uniref:Uncharacterized protein n=1 Tax=Aspergillus japonicus CBS 114.51 TaxID=1448312 RepID=A0A8T8WZU9_ASPJA|nr:hypothetical protein BO86DRAFT_117731 [Aspergillus japonicus CBS 114.51]RAH80912.1 hypothetical protein BO86DRAFT_117731 [Aspergillus japonicus CBS 114.51]